MTRTRFEIEVTDASSGEDTTWVIYADVSTLPFEDSRFEFIDGHETLVSRVSFGFGDWMDVTAGVVLKPVRLDPDPERGEAVRNLMFAGGWHEREMNAIQSHALIRRRRQHEERTGA